MCARKIYKRHQVKHLLISKNKVLSVNSWSTDISNVNYHKLFLFFSLKLKEAIHIQKKMRTRIRTSTTILLTFVLLSNVNHRLSHPRLYRYMFRQNATNVSRIIHVDKPDKPLHSMTFDNFAWKVHKTWFRRKCYFLLHFSIMNYTIKFSSFFEDENRAVIFLEEHHPFLLRIRYP